MRVSVAEAKDKLPKLIKAVEEGEPVTICRRGKPVVDIVPTKQPSAEKPKFGTLKNRIVVRDSNWWKAMTGEEADAFIGNKASLEGRD
jgi:prevent-host-death family protein